MIDHTNMSISDSNTNTPNNASGEVNIENFQRDGRIPLKGSGSGSGTVSGGGSSVNTHMDIDLNGFVEHYTCTQCQPTPLDKSLEKDQETPMETPVETRGPIVVPKNDSIWAIYTPNAPHRTVQCSHSYRHEFEYDYESQSQSQSQSQSGSGSGCSNLSLLDLLHCINTVGQLIPLIIERMRLF